MNNLLVEVLCEVEKGEAIKASGNVANMKVVVNSEYQ
jgi:hypothetical protein